MNRFLLVWLLTASASIAANIALKTVGSPEQFVEIAHSDAFHFNTNLTVEAWLFVPHDPTLMAGGPDYWIALNKTADDGGPSFSLGTGGKMFGFFVGRESDQHALETGVMSPNIVGFNDWSHVVGTFDGKTIRIFVNGEPRSDSNRPVSSPMKKSSQPILIGKEGPPGAENTWVGMVDEVRIWNRVLSAEEIRARMWIKLAGNEPGLVGYWNFDQNDARDLSSFGNHGVIRGNAQLVESRLFFASRPAIENARFVSGFKFGFEFQFQAEAKVTYVIQRSSDLFLWENVDAISDKQGPVTFVDSTNTGLRRAFYRVLVVFAGQR